MNKLYVFIYLPNEITATPAGIFEYDEKSLVGSFSYGRKYIEKYNTPVSTDLPISKLEKTTQEFNGLFGSFRDAVPDYWGRTVYASLNKKPIETITEHELLLSGGASRIGNLDFRVFLDSPEPVLSLPQYSSLEGLVDAAHRIQSGEEVEKAYRQLLEQGTSMGGMRPKCTIEDTNKLWIAKFPSRGDQYSNALIEASIMKIAKISGITVPLIRTESINGKDIFLIERFDRKFEHGGYTRKGFFSCLSALGKHEIDRGFGYPDLAEFLRKKGDTKGASELFKRMLFNIAVRNTDDHGRNHGIIFSENDFKLSPVYDITPTASKKGLSTEFDLALEVGTQGRLATIQNAFSLHERFGLTGNEAVQSLEDVTNALSNWKEVFYEYNVSEQDTNRFFYTMESAKERLKPDIGDMDFSQK